MEGETKSTKRATALMPATFLVLMVIVICGGMWLPLIQAEDHVSTIELQHPVDSVKAICNKTLYRELCYSSVLPHLGSSPSQPKKLLHLALMVAMDEANEASAHVMEFVKKSSAFQDCIELMDITREQLDSSISLLKRHDLKTLTHGQVSDMQTWLSASITNQDTCLDGISEFPKRISRVLVQSSVENVRKLISNSLAIAKATCQSKPHDLSPELRFPSESDIDGFPSWLSAGDRRLLRSSPNDVVADVTVAQDGSGNFRTITEAINAAPAKSPKIYVIKVRKGTYQEYVQVSKPNIMLVGDGIEATIVTGSRNVIDGSTTFNWSSLPGPHFSPETLPVGKLFCPNSKSFSHRRVPRDHDMTPLFSDLEGDGGDGLVGDGCGIQLAFNVINACDGMDGFRLKTVPFAPELISKNLYRLNWRTELLQ